MNTNENKNFEKHAHNHKCKCNNSEGKCNHTEEVNYGFYSKVLNKPFDSVAELKEAEAAYYAEIKVKEDKAAAKKADAKKVEDAYKNLNQARRDYKEKLNQLTREYSEKLTELKNAFELGKKDIHTQLAAAEEEYQKELKTFTDRYNQYHICLKDGDFETTISGSHTNTADTNLLNIFDLLFNF